MQKPKTAEQFLSIFCPIEGPVGAVVIALEVQTGIHFIINEKLELQQKRKQ